MFGKFWEMQLLMIICQLNNTSSGGCDDAYLSNTSKNLKLQDFCNQTCELKAITSWDPVEVNATDTQRAWWAYSKSPKCRNRAVIQNDNDLCHVKREMAYLSLREVWIDFSPSFSIDEFVDIRKNFGSVEPEKCVSLSRNDSVSHEFSWDLKYCNETMERACMNVSRVYWRWNGTNNIFIENCGVPINQRYDALKLDLAVQSVINSPAGHCSVRHNDSFIEIKVTNLSSCNENVAFQHYTVLCPVGTGFDQNINLALAEFTVSNAEMEKYMYEDFLPLKQRNRETVLPPLGNVLLSVNVINSTKSSTISFQYKFPYKKWLMVNAGKLTYKSGESGYLRTTYRYVNHAPLCVFIDEKSKKFNTTGCECIAIEEIAFCKSNHTTVFAILLSVESVEISHEVKILSMVMLSVSVLFLLFTFITLLWVRKSVRGDRIPIQINLSLSLMMLQFWLLWGDVAAHHPAFCRAHAVLLHFFLISTALWMMNEANLLLLKTSNWTFVATKRSKVVISTMIIGWGVTFVYVGVTAAMGFSLNLYMEGNKFTSHASKSEEYISQYGGLQFEHCWLNSVNGMRWSAIGPVMIILAYNLAVAIRTAVFIYRKRSQTRSLQPTSRESVTELHAEHLKNLYYSLKSVTLLFPVLGISWILMLIPGPSSENLQYANAVINGLQGVFVFFVYCIVDRKVKAASQKRLSSLADEWVLFADTLEKRRKSSARSIIPHTSSNEHSNKTSGFSND